jgi:mRNA interferase RelE/StbE
MTWTLALAKPAEKELKKLPRNELARVMAALRQMEQDPYQGDVTHLTNAGFGWRRRVGNYRILYDLDSQNHLIRVHHIVRRTTTTYRRQ